MKTTANVSAYYDVYLNGKHVGGGTPSKNLLLDTFFAAIKNLAYCRVGASSTPPTVGDPGVLSPIGNAQYRSTTTETGISFAGTVATFTTTKEFVFPVGAIVGNISEVAVSAVTDNTQALSRALIKDGTGTPITVPVTANDQLVVRWSLAHVIETRPSPQVLDVNGTPTTVTLRVCQISRYNTQDIETTPDRVPDFSNSFAYAYDEDTTITPPADGVSAYPTISIGTLLSVSTSIVRDFGLANSSKASRTLTLNATDNLPSGKPIKYIGFGGFNSTNVSMYLEFSPVIPKTSAQALVVTLEQILSR